MFSLDEPPDYHVGFIGQTFGTLSEGRHDGHLRHRPVRRGCGGLVAGVWLIRPLGLGLDEDAEKAALDYKFQPATLDGVPVATVMSIEVNFQIF